MTQLKKPQKPLKPYEPPRIVWETTFIALAQTTPPPCVPPDSPICHP